MKFAAVALMLALCGCHRAEPPREHAAHAPCTIAAGRAEVAGVLRNDGDGWYALADKAHAPLNIAGVRTDAGQITVRFTFTAGTIRTFIVTPDETLARQGLFTGASVEADNARIVIARQRTLDPFDISTKRFPWSNLWLYGLFDGARCT